MIKALFDEVAGEEIDPQEMLDTYSDVLAEYRHRVETETTEEN